MAEINVAMTFFNWDFPLRRNQTKKFGSTAHQRPYFVPLKNRTEWVEYYGMQSVEEIRWLVCQSIFMLVIDIYRGQILTADFLKTVLLHSSVFPDVLHLVFPFLHLFPLHPINRFSFFFYLSLFLIFLNFPFLLLSDMLHCSLLPGAKLFKA